MSDLSKASASEATSHSHVETEIVASHTFLAPAASSNTVPLEQPPTAPRPQVGGKTLSSILTIASIGSNEENTDADSQPSQESLDVDHHQSPYGGKTLPAILSYANQLPENQESNSNFECLTTPTAVEVSNLSRERPVVGGKSIALVTAHARPPEEVKLLSEDSVAPDYLPVIYPPATVAPHHSEHPVAEEGNNAEEEGGSDDGMSVISELSDGEDLRGDLEGALGGDFDFKGEFAFSSSLPQAPNPGLHIDGLGLIGLPLSHRDAQFIQNVSAQAPYGKGTETVVDTAVRDTWEIDPARIQFTNPTWKPYIDGTIVETVRKALGAISYTPPRCELYKLLLYKTGSHFLPHQDTEKSNGMFATIIVILPSQYEGGQVHLSHGPSKKIFDFSSSSAFDTSVLAWYTDVVHEVKPVTSGYRLVLSYNLIHTSSGIPPTLPDMRGAVAATRHIFRKWANKKYPPNMDRIVYLLEHQYSEHNLRTAALKGRDAHLIAQLRGAAEEVGIRLCLATLDVHITGCADDDGGSYYKRSRWGGYSDSDESDGASGTPDMMEESERSLSLTMVVTLDGERYLKSMRIDDEDLVPADPFEDVDPDEKEYEGYMGNGAGELQYWYHRTVLLLFPVEKEERLLLAAQGSAYAIKQISNTTTQPTAKDKRMFEYLTDHLITKGTNSWSAPMVDQGVARTLADVAIRWTDFELWKSVATQSGAGRELDALGAARLLLARKTFGAEKVRSILEQVLVNSPTFKSRIDFLKYLHIDIPEGEQESVVEWCNNQTEGALKTLQQPTVADAVALVEVGLLRGIRFMAETVIPQLKLSVRTFDFWITFIPTLHRNRKRLIAPPTSSAQEENARPVLEQLYSDVLSKCLEAAMSRWNSTPQHYSLWEKGVKIMSLISFCIDLGRTDTISSIFSILARDSRNGPSDATRVVILPLVAELRNTLARKQIDICSPPFKSFFRLAIGLHMRDLLGQRPDLSKALQLRRVGCGCRDCGMLDRFITHGSSREQIFRFGQSRRGHLEGRLHSLGNMVTYRTDHSGNPHGLVVTKKADTVIGADWQRRQAVAKAFLTSIGDDSTLQQLLGGLRDIVTNAINGRQAVQALGRFDDYQSLVGTNMPELHPQLAAPATISTIAQGTTTVSSTPTLPSSISTSSVGLIGSAPSTSLSVSSMAPPPSLPPPVAGQKRRKGIVSTTDVIDLTLDN
ncbi:hypothetical protein HYDPIDRAFT_123543 [Hydnomerulius pinastri MD-312]|nr:hypothetical protein HYDPIDRAFT_123543 [Hydnomerulius pinastri MD-312]